MPPNILPQLPVLFSAQWMPVMLGIFYCVLVKNTRTKVRSVFLSMLGNRKYLLLFCDFRHVNESGNFRELVQELGLVVVAVAQHTYHLFVMPFSAFYLNFSKIYIYE